MVVFKKSTSKFSLSGVNLVPILLNLWLCIYFFSNIYNLNIDKYNYDGVRYVFDIAIFDVLLIFVSILTFVAVRNSNMLIINIINILVMTGGVFLAIDIIPYFGFTASTIFIITYFFVKNEL